MKNLDKMKSLLESGEVDALLLTSEVSRHYAAQYNIAEGVAVVCKNRSYYFTDSRYIEAAEKNLPDFTVQMVDRDHSYILRINSAIEAETVKTLGFEENYLTYSEFTKYNSELHAVLKPYQKQIGAFRASKEAWELELMRKAQAITDRAFAEVITRIKPGMTELELQAELIYCMYKNGGTGLAFDPIVVSGPNTSLPHGVAGERVIQKGDFVTMDFGASYMGYCSDMTRTVAVGYATDEMKHVYDTVLKAQLTAIAATKAGVPGKDIDGTARKVIADAGYGEYFGHGYGHSLGLEIHENPSPNASNTEPLPAGVVCSAEPGIYLPGKFGVRIEDVTIITEEGCEDITGSPKNLIIL